MSETNTNPVPSPDHVIGRPEKTPTEVHAQIGRIAKKLVSRAAKLDLQPRPRTGTNMNNRSVSTFDDLKTGKDEIFGSSHNDKNYLTQGVHTDKTDFGTRTLATVRKEDAGHAAAGSWSRSEDQTTHELQYTEQDIRTGDQKSVSLRFTPEGSHGSYTTGNPNWKEDYRTLPEERNADNAAKILMKARGDIARVEHINAAQGEVDQLLK